MSKYAQGKFQLQNPQKYVGNKTPTYRSSWEFVFMQFCDSNPSILQWASEAIHINYRNPLTGRNTIYVPDFLITYVDANGNQSAEVIEVKPTKETTLEAAGKSPRAQAAAILNMAKWQAAQAWCKAHNLRFRVVTEQDIFHQGRAK
jgi:TnsA endonuclease N terminal